MRSKKSVAGIILALCAVLIALYSFKSRESQQESPEVIAVNIFSSSLVTPEEMKIYYGNDKIETVKLFKPMQFEENGNAIVNELNKLCGAGYRIVGTSAGTNWIGYTLQLK
jgi:hypothetical protein